MSNRMARAEREPKFDPDPKLHDYQVAARDFLRSHDRGALFLDMGLGKTAISLTALEPRHLPVLVVAPKRVAENVWSHEARLWRPDLRIQVAKGSPKKRAEVLRHPDADIVVLGRDNLRDILDLGPQDRRFNTLILDELSGFKSHISIRFNTARKFIKRHRIQHIWGLTGTPSPNGLLDLWSQIYLLDQGKRLGKRISDYRRRWFYVERRLPTTNIVTEWGLRPNAEEEIHAALEDLCLSMGTEGRIPLPEVTENTIEVELSPSHRKVYKAMKDDMVAILGLESFTSKNAAVTTTKLSQISAGFLYVDDADLRNGEYRFLHSTKAKAVLEVVEGTGGSPVLVFYHYRAELEMLRLELGRLAHTMDEPDIVERWNRGDIPVLLAHPASAGHGLNLQHGGHTIVWTTLPWSLEEWKQANKRLARQGQKHPVVIHVIRTKRTVDGVQRLALEDKSAVEGALRAHLESPL